MVTGEVGQIIRFYLGNGTAWDYSEGATTDMPNTTDPPATEPPTETPPLPPPAEEPARDSGDAPEIPDSATTMTGYYFRAVVFSIIVSALF